MCYSQLFLQNNVVLCTEGSDTPTHKVELDPLWSAQPVEFAEQRCDVIGSPCRENQLSSSVQDRLEPVH